MYTKDHSKHGNHHNYNLQSDFQRVKDRARETREAISQTAYDVKDKAHDLWVQSLKDAKEKTGDMQENVVTYMKEHPVKSVGFALIAGIVLSKLLKK